MQIGMLLQGVWLACCLLAGASSQAELLPIGITSLPLPQALSTIVKDRRLQASNCKTICKGTPIFPVCTRNSPVLGPGGISYASPCIAVCSGKSIAYLGLCVSKPCLCAPFFAPVCGGGKTYINPCFAKCAGVTTIKQGVCQSDCGCPDTKQPAKWCSHAKHHAVCGYDLKNYSNECKAACAGTIVQYSGTCDARVGNCKCPNSIDPICTTNSNQTYQSACIAACDGVDVKKAKPGVCPDFLLYHWKAWWCDCPLTVSPVCAQLGTGNPVTLNNQCTAKCLNYRVLKKGICTSCICPSTAKPVCVGKKTYRTACDARCKGKATTWTDGPCTPCSKCPAPTGPTSIVCGENNQIFPSACLAECQGVAVKNKGSCSVPNLG